MNIIWLLNIELRQLWMIINTLFDCSMRVKGSKPYNNFCYCYENFYSFYDEKYCNWNIYKSHRRLLSIPSLVFIFIDLTGEADEKTNLENHRYMQPHTLFHKCEQKVVPENSTEKVTAAQRDYVLLRVRKDSCYMCHLHYFTYDPIGDRRKNRATNNSQKFI